ncbi:MAG: 3-deoxy-manno-octulosonate cytidylyltransferase [Candidatus Nealsonbacteria bacterium]|nr:3-deoxy-manno-octulosonate cytidylyltransferase [Candidatus Nealsonbacteria bacterium]
MNIIGIIPARMASSRFPGKPMAKILGMPMVGHVYCRSKMSKVLNEVYIATCDKEIMDYANSIGAKAVMTKDTHERCTSRCAEAMLTIESETGRKVDAVVMIQGDEPMIFPEMIDLSLEPILKDPSIRVVNLMAPIKDRAEHEDPNCPKVVVDKNNFAVYFSREPIPSWKKGAKQVNMLKQVCVIAFARDFLLKFEEMEPTHLEIVESIDMNRILEHGHKIKMVWEDFETQCVDTRQDLEKVEELMAQDKLAEKYIMKYKVLVSAPYLQPVIGKYREMLRDKSIEIIVPKVNERLSEEELLNLMPDMDGILCGDDRLTERVLASSPKLKVISKWGTGIDSIDKEAAQKRGIPIKNTPNAFTDPVADTVMGLILCFSRGILDLNGEMKSGIWSKQLRWALNEKTLGVVGVGNIGKAVIKRAAAFGMKILANDIREVPGHELVSLEQLLKESDFVSINCDLNPTSRYLINKEALSLMKTTAYLINTARGPIVDETALVWALENKKIAGAGLDVFEEEPLRQDNPLRKRPNVILSPHNANAGEAAWQKVHENTINNLIEELLKNE